MASSVADKSRESRGFVIVYIPLYVHYPGHNQASTTSKDPSMPLVVKMRMTKKTKSINAQNVSCEAS